MKIQIENKWYSVNVIKKKNRNTYIRVKSGEIVITTNNRSSKKDLEILMNDNIDKIKDMLLRDAEKTKYNDQFYFLGKLYDIKLTDNINLDKWYRNKANEIFNDRLKQNFKLFDEDIKLPELKIKKLRAKWGMCHKQSGKITLSLELIKRSHEEIDYVIIHELAHLVHFNHSKDFWKVVEKYCPNWKIMRKNLSKY